MRYCSLGAAKHVTIDCQDLHAATMNAKSSRQDSRRPEKSLLALPNEEAGDNSFCEDAGGLGVPRLSEAAVPPSSSKLRCRLCFLLGFAIQWLDSRSLGSELTISRYKTAWVQEYQLLMWQRPPKSSKHMKWSHPNSSTHIRSCDA